MWTKYVRISAHQWLMFNSKVPRLPPTRLKTTHVIRTTSDWFAHAENEDFLDLLSTAFRGIFRPLLALKVMRNDRVAGAYIIFGPDQLDNPEQVRVILEGIGTRLQDLLYQTSDFFNQVAKRESLRRLSSVMHQINGPTGRATAALADVFEFLKSHREIGMQLIPDEKKARARAEMNMEAMETHTLAARLGDLSKAIEDIRKVSYQIRRLKWVQGDIPFQQCELKDILHKNINACVKQLPELKFELRCEDRGFPLQGNKEALSSAIEEVINNACRELREHHVPSPSIFLEMRRHGGRIMLMIRDNGLPEQSHLISEPFEEGASFYARSGRGSGLGLTIVQETFRKHGGECRLFENADESGIRVPGVTFEASLPLAQDESLPEIDNVR